MTSLLEWSGQREWDEQLHRDRVPLMRPVSYERTAAFSDTACREGHMGTALTINVSSGGMCLLMDWAPEWQEVLRVQVPMPIALAQTPTLAEVRWERPVPMSQNGLYFVGVRFIL